MVQSVPRYIRKLTVFLAISGSLNIILASILFYVFMCDRPPVPYFELKPANKQEQQAPLAIEKSDGEVIRHFRRMPLEWLVSRLDNTQLVENGYTQRDLALASLVAFYSFDLEKAFAGLPMPEQKRLIIYGKLNDGKPAEVVAYPGLSDQYFKAAKAFAARERWPLTSRGLFLALQKEEKEEYDPSLLDAFFMTSEFSSLELLFNRSGFFADKEELLKVVLEGSWKQLSEFAEQQRKSQDLSPARRQSFLLEYAKNKSKAAARLLLKTDGSFAARKLDDSQVIVLLNLLDEKSPFAEEFATVLMKSPRSDGVRELAAKRLKEYSGAYTPEVRPTPEPKKQLAEIKPVLTAAVKPSIVAGVKPSKDFYYTVQEGDSLWKIGRRFNVDVEVLRAFNHLESDVLHPGRSLRIPKK